MMQRASAEARAGAGDQRRPRPPGSVAITYVAITYLFKEKTP